MKHRLPAAALLLASALLLGGCAAGTQEQVDAISEKYGLESPTPHTPSVDDMDWGWSVKTP